MAWSDAARAAALEVRRMHGTHPKMEGAKRALIKAIRRTGAPKSEVMKTHRQNLMHYKKHMPLFKAKLHAVRDTTYDIQTYGALRARVAQGMGNPKYNSKYMP